MLEFQLPPPLNSKDFANLLADMFNEIYNTASFKCFGKNGHKQKGIDILSTEKDMVIQCKLKDLSRKKILVKQELFNDIDETIDFLLRGDVQIKFKTLYITTTFNEHPDFDEYCETIKEDRKLNFDVIFWGWETIQRKILALPNTVSIHFSNFIISNHSKETKLVSRLDMKRKIEQDFSDWLNYSFENRKRNSKMIIHSIDDTKYPDHELNKEGKYQWFSAEIRSRSHKGLEFTTAIEIIYVDKEFFWTDKLPKNDSDFLKVKVARVSILNYDDIVDYDLKGDEHYSEPHFFCKFKHEGSPFVEEYYLTINNENVPYYFDNKTRKIYD